LILSTWNIGQKNRRHVMAVDFRTRMRARERQARTGMANIMGQVMMDVGREVALATPVKSGVMRSNWVAGQAPVLSVRGAYTNHVDYAGSRERAETSGPNLSAVTRQHQIVAALHTNPAAPLFITNNTPYLKEVNYGTVKQTPLGFVERGVDRGAAMARARNPRIFIRRGRI
jgi:hypothetical protein